MIREVYAGNLENAIEKLNITDAKNTYNGHMRFYPDRDKIGNCQVWEIGEEGCNKLESLTYDDFHSIYEDTEGDAFYYWAEGCNLGFPDCPFVINGQNIIGYRRDNWEEYIEEEEDGSEYDGNTYEYDFLLKYLCDELGASMERNVVSICMDLAKANNMTMAELFQKYQG